MSALNDIPLTGCSPTPLASYLKALGVFRLVSEQADPAARGFWRNEGFVLSTTLTREQLAEFFLTRYAPTPLIDPWNKASGFLRTGKKDKSATETLDAISTSKLPRFDTYRKATSLVLNTPYFDELKKYAKHDKDKKLFEKTKPLFINECRKLWRGQALEWLDAAIIILSDASQAWPSLLGTGGNDGVTDFCANFRKCIIDTTIESPSHENTAALLASALYGAATTGSGNYKIGQFSPGVAGGANYTNGLQGGASGKANVNPWDFVLFMEGTTVFSAAASRRLGTTGVSSASAPFAIRANAIGHASVSTKEKSARGEQWLPLWERPATLREIRALLSEGRAQLGRNAAREPVDMARAIARLGVARGISAFERYGYIERNGQSTFAVPLGRWKVSAQPHQDLLSDIDGFLRRLSREAAGERATASLVQIARRLNDAILAVAADGASPARWQSVLIALGEADALTAALPPAKNKFGIVPRLRGDWLAAADDGSPEFRLAAAFASQERVRRHFLPLNKFGNQLDEKGGASVVCAGRDFVADAIAMIDRRLVESAKDASRSVGQDAGVFASLADIAVFLRGARDTGRILSLARALMAVDYEDKPRLSIPPANEMPDDTFALFRFCLAPRNWQKDIPIPARADIFRRLASGDLATASRLAAAHLRAHGHIPPLSLAAGDARRFAAALAFPLSRASRDTLSHSFISTARSQ